MVTKQTTNGWWILEGDTALGKYVEETGNLIGETAIAELPQVRSLGGNDVVLDIGAFIGDTALIFLERTCTVLAFEPYLDAFACMEKNLVAYERYFGFNTPVGNGGWVTMDGDFGEEPGNGKMNFGTRRVRENPMSPDAKRELAIDDLGLDRVDFVKIDVEGREPLVLFGMQKTMRRCRPTILIECYDTLLRMNHWNRDVILTFLRNEGYDLEIAIGRDRDDRCDYLATPKR